MSVLSNYSFIIIIIVKKYLLTTCAVVGIVQASKIDMISDIQDPIKKIRTINVDKWRRADSKQDT